MSGITPDELADIMTAAGKPISANVIRYHCRDPRGMLHHAAERIGRSWSIPAADADAFAARWTPYQSLRRRT